MLPPAPIQRFNLFDAFDIFDSLDGLDLKKKKAANSADTENLLNILHRQQVTPLINARDDISAVATWLTNFKGHTLSNYRREAERFLLWLHYFFATPKMLKDVNWDDIQSYQQFCQNPQPIEFWCMPAKYPRQHVNWRPFYQPLQHKSLALALNILNILFGWLQRANYLMQNPFSLRPRNSQAHNQFLQERYIPEILWEQIEKEVDQAFQTAHLAYLNDPSTQNIQALQKVLRPKWLLQLFYRTGLRMSEALENSMAGFELEYLNSGEPLVWLRVLGKGQKQRRIPAPLSLLKTLAFYRVFVLKIGALPQQIAQLANFKSFASELLNPLQQVIWVNEAEVSLAATIKAMQIQTPHRSALHLEIKNIFKIMYIKIIEDKNLQHLHALAPILLKASAHWVRHSIWTHMANHHVDLRIIRDNAGHSSIATTNIYLHSEAQKRHAASIQFSDEWIKN